MKTIISYRHLILAGLVWLMTLPGLHAQNKNNQKETAKTAAMEKMIAAKHFVFRAQSASPTGGKLIQLSYGFFLKFYGDTIISYLPYYGQGHAPVLSGENKGIDFTSLSNDYKTENRKKGGWDITLVPKDYDDVEKIFLTVFENGKTSVQVLSRSRSPISYDGFIEAPGNK